ncbi:MULTISPECIES: DNA repair exonuclease [unclassified Mesorhizobium]|uniref:metallophosphoesterase family protein n=1 Tax=unclassified Mesorhizobium TaxID=325217 RepID=UPI0007ECEE2B|nr:MULTISPECIES: DNA repair exonuclease [unclassified Mesorhizobium]ARP68182.1 DNA repair exonuclease [Mesorhizobium sp. WSM1497]RUY21775.1 DNA repair exonuclease [Mesorhizobium sp. M7A.F.Ca.US.001.04.2.1]RUY35002.1 DNA repair exonuclease [Mesorhizobium sp. M7A.F.Ca.US.001.04.1.1]RVA03135.1 DNA repair exonuclease [Mesorhizobium sp. M7A.F.Ca.US.001.02.1.1]RVA09885.1 DNA repair exonuclease [Mesorhizobium sp. M7A.F.Ca.US.002.01.1.1]
MPFRFVHTADIHLDSPLRSLALRNGDLAELVGDASRQAFVSIVDLCLAERVDALVIAGDLYDGDQTSMKTARFLASQMTRLHQAGIRVFKIRGNHDALSRISKQLVFPETVTIFGGRPQSVLQTAAGLDVMFHGLSFASPKAPDSLLPKYSVPREGAVNVGIMHTSLAGSPGHDVYAPCNATDLHAHGFDYWALGHIHVRQVHPGASTVVMPGIPQGRDINEAGEKSVTLVTIRDDRTVEIEERLTSIAQFERVNVDLTEMEEWSDVVGRVRSALERVRASVKSRHAVVRLDLTGASPLSWALIRDRDLLLAEAEQAAEQTGDTWVEKLELKVSPSTSQTCEEAADPIFELAQSMRADAGSDAFRAEARALVQKMVADLPPDGRDFAGKDEAELELFLDRVLANGANLVTARLKAGGSQ